MAEAPYLMGIDYGTGGVRVGLFDREGTPAGFHAEEFETRHPRPGRAEQDPDEWWSALVGAVHGAMKDSGVAPEDIAGISTDATSSTIVPVDEDGRHLAPAILWMDVRAAEQARRVQETGDPALKYNGHGPVSAEWGLPKALWIKENDPDAFGNARYLAECGDWAIHRLTGEWAMSVNMAASKFYYDRDEGGWPESLYEAVGGADILEKFPENVMDLGVVVGGLRDDVASELGLKAGTPVAEGGIDAYMGALGLGVVEPGRLALITGSSHVIIGQTAQPIHDRAFWGAYTDAMIPGQYTVEAGQVSTGSIVAWFKKNFAGGADYDTLNELASKLPVGSEGLIALDYFQGNRLPYTDPHARGLLSGLTLHHGQGHVFRAIIEGICYGTEHIFRSMREHDFEPRMNVVSGGAANSDLWMQIHADVSNVPITLTRVSEGPVLGSAMLASIGAGVYPDAQAAAKEMVHFERTVEPDESRHEEYSFWVDRYIELYPAVKDTMHKAVERVAQSDRPVAATEA